jgi:hypothetical protein
MPNEPQQATLDSTTVKFAGFILEKYGAPKLSELTNCGAPHLEEPPNYLGSFVINSMVNLEHSDPLSRIILMFGRRAEHAIREYVKGRELLGEYVKRLGQTNAHFLLAMRATTHFEQCVASICQAAALLDRIIAVTAPNSPPEPEDDREQRLKLIWNRSKHFEDDLGRRWLADAEVTAPVWLTNQGISCSTYALRQAPAASITFEEVHSFLTSLLDTLKFLSEDLPNAVKAKRLERDAPGADES